MILDPISNKMPMAVCPACGKEVDAATGVNVVDARAPKPNDLTICFYCAELGCYTESLTLRALEPGEFERFSVSTQTEIRRFQSFLRAHHAE